jgi:hypothetical protein
MAASGAVLVSFLACGGWFSFALSLLQSVAVAVHLQDMDMVGEPVEQGAGKPLRAEDFGPFCRRAGCWSRA